MIEMDRNDPVVNTGRSSEENDLVGSRQRKWPEQDRAEIENEENKFVVGVTGTGTGTGLTDEEVASCRRVNTFFSWVHHTVYVCDAYILTDLFFSSCRFTPSLVNC